MHGARYASYAATLTGKDPRLLHGVKILTLLHSTLLIPESGTCGYLRHDLDILQWLLSACSATRSMRPALLPLLDTRTCLRRHPSSGVVFARLYFKVPRAASAAIRRCRVRACVVDFTGRWKGLGGGYRGKAGPLGSRCSKDSQPLPKRACACLSAPTRVYMFVVAPPGIVSDSALLKTPDRLRPDIPATPPVNLTSVFDGVSAHTRRIPVSTL